MLMHIMMHTWKAVDIFQELFLSFQLGLSGLHSKCSYVLNYLTDKHLVIFPSVDGIIQF